MRRGRHCGRSLQRHISPALNILIKLMSMVSLTVAPMLSNKADWDEWYLGIIPLVIFLVTTVVLMAMQILTWKDPIAEMQARSALSETKMEEKDVII